MTCMGSLPEGYRLILGKRPPGLFEAAELTLERPDGSPVATFAPEGGYLEDVKRAARRDYRERTLRVLEDE